MADFHIWATYLIIAATVVGYVSERWPIEAVALASLAALLALFTIFPFASADGLKVDPDLLKETVADGDEANFDGHLQILETS